MRGRFGTPNAQVLLGRPEPDDVLRLGRKAEGGKLSHDTLERVSYVLGIYKALQLLFSNPDQADARG